MKLKSLAISLAIFTVLTLSSCSNTKWLSSLDDAKSKAQRQNKNIYLLFSGDDFDDSSVAFKQSVTNTKEFEELFKDYILVNIIFSETDYSKTQNVPEDADKKTLREIEKIEQEYKEKMELSRNYGVQSFPSAYILSPEGFVLLAIPFDPAQTNAQEYKSEIDSRNDEIIEAKDLLNAVKASQGIEKVQAIEALCQSENGQLAIGSLRPYIEEVLVLDSTNESGLLGEFLIRDAYFKSFDAISNNEDPALSFENIVESEFLNPSLKQEAYFLAAYNLAMVGSSDFDRMIDNLQKAYDIDPESNQVQYILQGLEQIKQMKEIYAQMSEADAITSEDENSADSSNQENQNQEQN